MQLSSSIANQYFSWFHQFPFFVSSFLTYCVQAFPFLQPCGNNLFRFDLSTLAGIHIVLCSIRTCCAFSTLLLLPLYPSRYKTLSLCPYQSVELHYTHWVCPKGRLLLSSLASVIFNFLYLCDCRFFILLSLSLSYTPVIVTFLLVRPLIYFCSLYMTPLFVINIEQKI